MASGADRPAPTKRARAPGWGVHFDEPTRLRRMVEHHRKAIHRAAGRAERERAAEQAVVDVEHWLERRGDHATEAEAALARAALRLFRTAREHAQAG